MYKKTRLFVNLTLSALLASCACFSKNIKDIYSDSHNSVVLVKMENGRCSGFVVRSKNVNYVITAGHCVSSEDPIQEIVFDVDGKETVNKNFDIIVDDDKKDIAILRPHEKLSTFKPLDIDDNIPVPGERLVSMGFPFFSQGEVEFDTGFFKTVLEDEKNDRLIYIADGVAYRGYSGSAVLNEQGKVVAIVSAIAPMIDIYGDRFHHTHKDLSILVSSINLKELLKDI